jgi:hypothetical protein
VNSDLCKKFFVTRKEYEEIIAHTSSQGTYFFFIPFELTIGVSIFTKTIGDEIKVWMDGKQNGFDVIHIADPLAVYLARYPEVRESIGYSIATSCGF